MNDQNNQFNNFEQNQNQQPQQQGNYQPQYQAPGMKPQDGKGFSVAGLVCGIIGAVFGWFGIVGVIALVCAIVGIIFAVKGRKMSTAVHGKPSGIATAGLVLGIIGASLAGIGVLACTVCVACVGNAVGWGSLFV